VKEVALSATAARPTQDRAGFDAGSGVYALGEKVHVRVVIEDPSAKRWGFQLTARPESNPDASAGRLETAGNDTQVISSCLLQWITHTAGGTRLGSTSSVTFEFDWTAPDSAFGPVVFYAAANAANGNGNSDGDRIYASNLRLAAAAAVQRPAFTSSGVTEISTGQAGIAPGAWVSIAGSDVADQVAYWSPVQGKQLETTVGKVIVKVNGVAAPLSLVSPAKVTFLVPAGTPDGDVPIVVESDGRVSDTSDCAKSLCDARILQREVVVVSGAELDLATRFYRERPVSVELNFVQPIRALWQPVGAQQQHRFDESRLQLLLRGH